MDLSDRHIEKGIFEQKRGFLGFLKQKIKSASFSHTRKHSNHSIFSKTPQKMQGIYDRLYL